MFGGVEGHLVFYGRILRTEAVKSLSLAFKCVHYVQSSDGLASRMFRVCNGILYNVFKEGLEDSTRFFVHKSRDALDTTTTGQTANRWLCDALDVVSDDLAMALGASLSFSFS